MANRLQNRPSDDTGRRPGGSPYDDDELRRITGIGIGEEDQMEAAAAEGAKKDSKKGLGQKALKAGLIAGEAGTFGEKAKAAASLGRKGLEQAEKDGFDFSDLHNPGWYKKQAGRGAKKGIKGLYDHYAKKHIKALSLTILFPLVAAIVMLGVLFFAGSLKHIHFEEILRAANFARFQLIVRKQFSAVIFNAAVLTDDSVGNYRNSPIVRAIRAGVPDHQLGQLGRSGRVQWEFWPNGRFGDELLPFRESLKAVIVDGQRFELDQFARDQFGRDFKDLGATQKFRVGTNFVRAVFIPLGNTLSLPERSIHWRPGDAVRVAGRIVLNKFADKGHSYLGKDQKKAQQQLTQETARKVMDPGGGRARSGISDINNGGQDVREEFIEAAEEGRPMSPENSPGGVRQRIANKAGIARGVSDAAFALTAYCIGREIVKIFTPEYQTEREAQAARAFANDATTTDQIKSGDVTLPAVNAVNGQWDARGDIPDASNSAIYRELTNQPPPPSNPNYTEQIPWLNPMYALGEWQDEFQAYNKIAGPVMLGGSSPLFIILSLFGINIGQDINDGACNVIMDARVQYGIAITEVVVAVATLSASKGVTAAVKGTLELMFHLAVGYGLDRLLGVLIEWVIKEYAGLYFTGLAQGADRVGETYVAGNSIAQNSNRNVTFGRPLDQGETNEAQQLAMEALRAENRQKPFSERYFAIDNPYSLAGLAIAKIPVSTGGFAATIQNGMHFMGFIISAPAKLLGSLGSAISPFQPAYAAPITSTSTNFGVKQWGWPVEEQQRIETDPTFSIIADPGQDPPLLARVEPRINELNARYGKCYNPSFALQSNEPKDSLGRDYCTKELLSEEDAIYWRHYMSLLCSARYLGGSVTEAKECPEQSALPRE